MAKSEKSAAETIETALSDYGKGLLKEVRELERVLGVDLRAAALELQLGEAALVEKAKQLKEVEVAQEARATELDEREKKLEEVKAAMAGQA